MPPYLADSDPPGVLAGYAERVGGGLMASAVDVDATNGIFGELRLWVDDPTAAGAMPDLVRNVRPRRVPPQVRQRVVSRVAVIVAALHPDRAWAHERLEHESVDPGVSAATWPACPPEADARVELARPSGPTREKRTWGACALPCADAATVPRPDVSEAAHLVERPTRDRLPNLGHSENDSPTWAQPQMMAGVLAGLVK